MVDPRPVVFQAGARASSVGAAGPRPKRASSARAPSQSLAERRRHACPGRSWGDGCPPDLGAAGRGAGVRELAAQSSQPSGSADVFVRKRRAERRGREPRGGQRTPWWSARPPAAGAAFHGPGLSRKHRAARKWVFLGESGVLSPSTVHARVASRCLKQRC